MRVPNAIATPLIFKRPSSIQRSISRREPIPPRASTFWIRSPESVSVLSINFGAAESDRCGFVEFFANVFCEFEGLDEYALLVGGLFFTLFLIAVLRII